MGIGRLFPRSSTKFESGRTPRLTPQVHYRRKRKTDKNWKWYEGTTQMRNGNVFKPMPSQTHWKAVGRVPKMCGKILSSCHCYFIFMHCSGEQQRTLVQLLHKYNGL